MLTSIITLSAGGWIGGGVALKPGEDPLAKAQRYLAEARQHIEQAREQKIKQNLRAAKAEYAKAEHTFTDAKNLLKKAPDSAQKTALMTQAYLERGDGLREQKLLKAARASYEKAQRYSPEKAQQKLNSLPPSASAKGLKRADLQSAFPMISGVSASLALPQLTLSMNQPMMLTTFFEQNPPPISPIRYPVAITVEEINNTHQLAVALQQIDLPAEKKKRRYARWFSMCSPPLREVCEAKQ